jgi:mannose-6-phosphate isomerase class I
MRANEDELHSAIRGPSIAIATQGGGTIQGEMEVKEGSVFYIGAGHSLNIKAGNAGLELYRAIVE